MLALKRGDNGFMNMSKLTIRFIYSFMMLIKEREGNSRNLLDYQEEENIDLRYTGR